MAEPNQRSFLLRLWRDHAGAPWRTTLIDVAHASEAHHLATRTSRRLSRPSLRHHAACHMVTRIASVSMKASAARMATPWNADSGRSNWIRVEL